MQQAARAPCSRTRSLRTISSNCRTAAVPASAEALGVGQGTLRAEPSLVSTSTTSYPAGSTNFVVVSEDTASTW